MFSFQLPKKPVQQAAPIKKPNLFGDDDGDDGAQIRPKLPHLTTQIAQVSYQKMLDDTSSILLEDPTIFSYDDHYDEINTKRQEIQDMKKQKVGSKYIGNLKQASEKRKIEQSMIHERIAEKELKREGDLSNGQKYVTSSFKKLMEEGNKFLAEDQAKEEYNKKHGAQNEENVLGLYKELYQQDVFMGGFRPDLSTMINKDKNAPPAQKQEQAKVQEQPKAQVQAQEPTRKEAPVSRQQQQREVEPTERRPKEERKYRDYDERERRDRRREERSRSRSRSKSPRVKAPPKEEKEEEKVQKVPEVEKEKPLTKEEKLRLAKERYQQRKQNQAAAPEQQE